MITIERAGIGYKMKFSNPGTGRRGFSVRVRDVQGIHVAIDHYYVRGHDEEACALCAASKEESHAH